MARRCNTCELNPQFYGLGPSRSGSDPCSFAKMEHILRNTGGDCSNYSYAYSLKYPKSKDNKTSSESSSGGLFGFLIGIIVWIVTLAFKIIFKWPLRTFPKFLWKKGTVGKILTVVFIVIYIFVLITVITVLLLTKGKGVH